MSYYREQIMAFRQLDDIINKVKSNSIKSISVSLLILQLTSRFAVSERAIKRRIDYHLKADPNLVLDGDDLKYDGGDD